MAKSVVQRNNGGPKGYGQPEKKNMRSALMRPEDEEVFGLPPDEGEMRLTGQEEAPSVYPAQPQYRNQPKSPYELKDEGVSTGATGPMEYDRSNVSNPRLNPAQRNYTQRNTGVAGGVDRGQAEQATGAAGGALGGMFGRGGNGGQTWRDIGTRPQGGMVQGSPEYLASQAQTKSMFSTPMDPNDPRMAQGGQAPTTWANVMDQYARSGQFDPSLAGDAQKFIQPQGGLPGLAQGDPSQGAMAQYGTGNIAGAGGIQTGNFMGQLEGFNTGGWGTGERGTESIKNTMGRLMSRVDVSQPGAVDALLSQPEMAQLFPMARKVEHPNGDLIDFGDGNGPVDVIRGAVAGGSGAAWQWGAGGGEAPSGPGGPSAMAYQGGIPQQAPTGQMDNTGMPEVMDQNSAMEFLNWLMSQQQQGQQSQGMI